MIEPITQVFGTTLLTLLPVLFARTCAGFFCFVTYSGLHPASTCSRSASPERQQEKVIYSSLRGSASEKEKRAILSGTAEDARNAPSRNVRNLFLIS
ncbi:MULTISPECIES: hypothetical protein [Enterobacterales]|uniref:hypothetical protein n=1 Tax=Enterobacterales TaxID=91347 RepID=UPI002ED99D7B